MSEFSWQPRGGLVADYCDVFGPTTDAPRQFHVFTCLSLMAALMGRRVWVRDGAAPLYPNLFVLLLAPSSLYRKSTCVAIGQDLARALEGHERPDAPARRILYPSQFTPESLLDILEEQPEGWIVLDEFRQFLDSMRRDYNAGMREMFMSLYDCRSIHRKIRSGEKRIEKPGVNLIGACATAWFADAVKSGELRSGFYQRLLIVAAQTKTRHLARGQAPDSRARLDLLRSLNLMAQAAGEMELPQAQESAFGDWALGQQKTILGTDHEAELAGFYTRLERVALKLATLLELSRNPHSRAISSQALADGISLSTWLQGNVRRLFEKELSFDPADAIRRKLLTAIEKAPIGRRDLMRKAHLDARAFDAAITTLTQTEQIHQRDGLYTAGPPPARSVSPASRAVTAVDVTPNYPPNMGNIS